MSGISGINTNYYNPLTVLPAQNSTHSGTQSSNTAGSASTTPSASSIQTSEESSLIQNSFGSSQSGSFESLAASLSNLQLIGNSNMLQTNPSLAGQILGTGATNSSSKESSLIQNSLGSSQSGSLESLAASLSNLQLISNSNMLQTNPSLAGQLLGAGATNSSTESFLSSTANFISNVNTVTQQKSPATQYLSQSTTPSALTRGMIVNTFA